MIINYDEELNNFKPSLEVDAVEDAIVRSDLTDMTDLMMQLLKDNMKE